MRHLRQEPPQPLALQPTSAPRRHCLFPRREERRIRLALQVRLTIMNQLQVGFASDLTGRLFSIRQTRRDKILSASIFWHSSAKLSLVFKYWGRTI